MANDETKSVFETKLVQFSGRTVSIVMQHVDGPCPLIAICNVLLLRGDIELSQETRRVTLIVLLNLVEKWLCDPNRSTGGFFFKKQPRDILEVLEGFTNFVELDVGFSNIHDFEFTLKMAVFKALNIELVHGWLVEDEATTKAIGDRSYNNLLDRLTVLQVDVPTCSGSVKENLNNEKEEGLQEDGNTSKEGEENLIRSFVRGHQLTFRGLFRLHEALQEQKLYVLYRQYHFSTLFKHNKELYMLVTDVSYKDEPKYVWEKLNQVDGSSEFYTADFTLVNASLEVHHTVDLTAVILVNGSSDNDYTTDSTTEVD